MTARGLLDLAGGHPWALLALFCALPVAAVLLAVAHGRGRGGTSPWRYAYSVLVYAACLPGVGAAVVTAYTLFFTHENLLDKNLLVYLLPVLSLVVTLGIASRNVSLDAVPSFDRLSGLIVLLALTFAAVLALRRTFIGIFFGGSLAQLAVVGAAVFALLRWASYALFRRRDEPRQPPPSLSPR